MRVRSDLVGVVHVSGMVLAAGDTIPDGVSLGDHLIIESDGEDSDGARKPGRRRSPTRARTDG